MILIVSLMAFLFGLVTSKNFCGSQVYGIKVDDDNFDFMCRLYRLRFALVFTILVALVFLILKLLGIVLV